jgi:AraC-like DNA-binding protein
MFASFHRSLTDADATPLRRQALLADALRGLLMCSAERAPRARVGGTRRAVERARDYIHDAYDCEIHLDDLAQVSGLSPYHLSRQFARQVGVPPHQYQILVRVERARELLAMGVEGATASASAGFADQSHMIRCFKRVWGVGPTAYVRGSTPATSPSRMPPAQS